MYRRNVSSEAYPVRLLDDYVSIMRRRPAGSAAATALRTRSLPARRLLSHAAAGGTATLDQLLRAARGRAPQALARDRLNAQALGDLASVVALQDLLPDDQRDGLALLELGLDLLGPAGVPGEHQGLHAQLAYHLGHCDRAAELLGIYARMDSQVAMAVAADLKNPFADTRTADADGWLPTLCRLLPEPHPTLDPQNAGTPFDRLMGVAAKVAGDDLISVIVTSFRPGPGLITAVRSLMDQSWPSIEVVIVDDGSPPEFDLTLEHCLGLDPRIRLVKLSDNAGTYVARNAGMDVARGRFVTFQDSDDWSHPRRLEQQVQPLLCDDSLVATTSEGLRMTENLIITRPGRIQQYVNPSSLMFRRDVGLRRLGYFDRVRKAADSEYLHRFEAVFGDRVHRMRGDALALIRLSPGSLSRAEIRPGWLHPARAAYMSAYRQWHHRIKDGEAAPYLPRKLVERPFAAPAHLQRSSTTVTVARRYDVIFASEWRRFGGPQKSMLEEIRALTRRGLRVGILQMEAFRFMNKRRTALCHPIQKLINEGIVDHVLGTDAAETTLLIIRYPPVLQFAAVEPSRVRAGQVIILANQAPAERDGTDHRYVPSACTEAARKIFGVEPKWCPQGPAVRDFLDVDVIQAELTRFDMPGIVDADSWAVDRGRFRSDLPVLGKHSRDNWTKWPADRDTLLQVYPATPDVDVRFMGGTKALEALLKAQQLPVNWLTYDYDAVPVRAFLNQLDFYVYYPHENMVEAFGRAILEALAAGCVVILPHHFSRTFGDAALYRRPDEVAGTVRSYHGNRELFLDQSRRAEQRIRGRYSHAAYVELVTGLMT